MPRILDGAPEFKARGARGRGEPVEVALPGAPGRWRVVFFYPRDFSPLCPVEVAELSRRMPELRALGAEVVGVSVDDVETHLRWIREALGEVAFPLVADPDRSIARAYGALLDDGVAARATFVVDPGGVVQSAAFQPPAALRSISELLRVLEALQAAAGDAGRRPGTQAPAR